MLFPASYNRAVGLALFCPVTGRAKGYPFEVPLPAGLPVSGVVLADHMIRRWGGKGGKSGVSSEWHEVNRKPNRSRE